MRTTCLNLASSLVIVLLAACGKASPGNVGTPDGGGVVQPPGQLGDIQITKNRGSVLLTIPAFTGAKDYRAYVKGSGVTAVTDSGGHEHVAGGTIHCAGVTQRSQCSSAEVLPIVYNNSLLDMPTCGGRFGRTPDVPTPVKQTIEVEALGAGATIVVEAIDRLCPFPGLFGPVHKDVKVTGVEMPGTTEDVTVNGKAYTITRWPTTYPVRTEAEIVAQYGSMILNGQGWQPPVLDPNSSAFPESPYIHLAQPAPADDPVVLGTSEVIVTTLGSSVYPDGFSATDYFDDFEDSTDQPVLKRATGNVPSWMENINYPIPLYQTKKWNLYDVRNEFSEFFVDRGQLMMVFGDPAQDSMSVQAMYPRRAIQISQDASQYLHVTYETSHVETSRRYEEVTLCGADTAGQTYVGEIPASAPLPRPGFMNEGDTARTSPLGWNCLYLTARGQGYGDVAGGDGVAVHSDTTMKVTVVKTHPAPANQGEYDTHMTNVATQYGPSQENPYPRTWERRIDANKQPVGPLLDDQLSVWQKTKFDIYMNRGRVVYYVNGEQRMCSNLTDPLTMAEGALGFWHVLYHTSAEFLETRESSDSAVQATGLHHVMHNTPWASERNWDNVGFRENASLPSGFDATVCF